MLVKSWSKVGFVQVLSKSRWVNVGKVLVLSLVCVNRAGQMFAKPRMFPSVVQLIAVTATSSQSQARVPQTRNVSTFRTCMLAVFVLFRTSRFGLAGFEEGVAVLSRFGLACFV